MSDYRGNTRAMDDMGNLMKALSEERGEATAILDSILGNRERTAELVLMFAAYVASVWEQMPQMGVMWAAAKKAMLNERN